MLGLIDAALGRKDEALREGRRAVELLPITKDALSGSGIVLYFAMIAAWVGEKDLACEQLARARIHSREFSYGQLKLLPSWDPLRGEPCFEELSPRSLRGKMRTSREAADTAASTVHLHFPRNKSPDFARVQQ